MRAVGARRSEASGLVLRLSRQAELVYARDLPDGIELVVDLTAEFAMAKGIANGRDYICMPTLDTGAPGQEAFVSALRRISECDGGVFIHCASGHGRSAMLAAAVLIDKGIARTAEEAERILQQARPGIRLKPAQKAMLEDLASR